MRPPPRCRFAASVCTLLSQGRFAIPQVAMEVKALQDLLATREAAVLAGLDTQWRAAEFELATAAGTWAGLLGDGANFQRSDCPRLLPPPLPCRPMPFLLS